MNKEPSKGQVKIDFRRRDWRVLAVQAILLLALWLILSGHYDVFHVTLGVISVAIVLHVNRRIGCVRFFDHTEIEREPLRFEYLAGFIVWLAGEVVAGSLHVAYIVLHPRMPIAPSILRFRAHLPTMGAKAILGNIITLTPGTVTLDITGDRFVVHTLTPKSSENIIDGTMPRRVAELHDEGEGEVISEITVTRNLEDL